MFKMLYILICFMSWFVVNIENATVLLNEVNINGNITEEFQSNGMKLNCTFNIKHEDTFTFISLAAQNLTTGKFENIAGASSETKHRLQPFGLYLFGNETTALEFVKNVFMLKFNNLRCIHERQYKCVLGVNFGETPINSDIMQIYVTVHPSQPVISMSSHNKNFTNTVEQMDSNVNLSQNNNRNINSSNSNNDTYEIAYNEGDNVTFVCVADVGRPQGRFIWQILISAEITRNFTNVSTDTRPKLCSYEGNSTLTIQVTGADNQAIVRCFIETDVSTVTMYADSTPLLIYFKVSSPSIALLPNKTVFHEGDSIELYCKAFGNPNPSFTWIKGNRSNETIVGTDSFIIRNANISDSGLYTCNTSNSIDGIVYSENISTYIDIAGKPTTSSSATLRPVESDNKEVIVGVSVGVIVGVILVLLITGVIHVCTKRHTHKAAVLENIQTQNYTNKYAETENNDTNSEDNQQQEDTYEDAPEDFYDEAGNRRHKEPTNCEPFDHTGTAQDISAESNEPNERNDSTIMLSCYPKSHNQSKSSGYESVEMDGVTPVLLSKSNGNEQADAELIKQHNEKYLQNQKEEDEKVNKSPGSHQHVEYAQIDETKKLKNKNKQNDQETIEKHEETTFESEEMHPKTDVNVDHFDKPNIKKSLTSSENTKQEENRNAETRQEIHEGSGRTVDNATYFDTSSHLESMASSEDNKQKENKNARTPLGNQESWNRTIENAEYFDTTHLEKQHNHKDPDTAIRNDQTTLYINQAFDGKDNQEEDTVSSPVQILHGLQEDEKSNQNNDKQSKHDYENVGSTTQPESSNGDTIH